MPPPRLPREIVEMEAARAMRLHHMLWHTSRNSWLRFSPEAREKFEQLGWAPPRPAIDAERRPILDNHSGEDFLFMHRRMISAVNARLAEVADPDYPKVEGWARFPLRDDADWPVPAPYASGNPQSDESLARLKSPEHFAQTFQPEEQKFVDRDFLRSMSLGELGARVEFTVHNWAHRRWAAKPNIVRPPANLSQPKAVDESFDAPSYDWLEDFYSSHVNPTFWKLHGWVDARIDAWMSANEVDPEEFEWTGTWDGPAGMHDPHIRGGAAPASVAAGPPPDADAEAAGHAGEPELLLRLAAEEGLEASPRDEVKLRL